MTTDERRALEAIKNEPLRLPPRGSFAEEIPASVNLAHVALRNLRDEPESHTPCLKCARPSRILAEGAAAMREQIEQEREALEEAAGKILAANPVLRGWFEEPAPANLAEIVARHTHDGTVDVMAVNAELEER